MHSNMAGDMGSGYEDPAPQRTANPDEMREYASLSQLAYDHTDETPSTTYQDYGWSVTGGGDDMVVFSRAGEDGTPEYAVAYKGTSLSGPTAVENLTDDAVILAGAESNVAGVGTFDESSAFTQKVIDEMAGGDASRVTVTGHSLGGTKAMQASKTTGAKAIVYNPGVSPLSVTHYYTDPGLSDVTIYHTAGDPVSSSARLLNKADSVTVHTVRYVPRHNPHSLKNFLD